MFQSDDLRDRPIPPTGTSATSADYHEIPFDPGDPRRDEPLVDIAAHGIAGESYYARSDGLNDPYRRRLKDDPRILCRRSVARALAAVNAHLAGHGIELFVLDGHRDVDTQTALWTHFMDGARAAMPGADEAALTAFATRFCSDPRRFDPMDATTWPLHSTGGAVDLTLRRRKTGELLFMGGIFDDAAPESFTRHFEQGTDPQSASADAARRHRRLLYHAMRAEGFTNYPYEWWHFDLGTQMWALVRTAELGRAVPAHYGYVPAPPA